MKIYTLIACVCLTICNSTTVKSTEICSDEDTDISRNINDTDDNTIKFRNDDDTISDIELPYPEWNTIPNLQEVLLAKNISISEELEKLDGNFVDNKLPSNLVSSFINLKNMIQTIYDKEHKSKDTEDDIDALNCIDALDAANELATQAKQLFKYRSNYYMIDSLKKLMHIIELIGVDQTDQGYTIKVGITTTHSTIVNHITTNKPAEQILHKYVKTVFIDFIKYVLKYVYQKICTTPIDINVFSEMDDYITKVCNVIDPNIRIFMSSICEIAENINTNINKLIKINQDIHRSNNSLEFIQKIIDEFYSFSSQLNYLIRLINENDILNKDKTIMQGYLPEIKRM